MTEPDARELYTCRRRRRARWGLRLGYVAFCCSLGSLILHLLGAPREMAVLVAAGSACGVVALVPGAWALRAVWRGRRLSRFDREALAGVGLAVCGWLAIPAVIVLAAEGRLFPVRSLIWPPF